MNVSEEMEASRRVVETGMWTYWSSPRKGGSRPSPFFLFDHSSAHQPGVHLTTA